LDKNLKILIIENEVYLAQSISTKLSELGHTCEMCTSTRDAIKSTDYDVVLLSTSINGQDFNPVLETFKRSIVILMVSYISNDTVSKPLAAGAKDYILKPFMIEELIRKINHFQEFERLKKNNVAYKKYLDHNFASIERSFLEKNENSELPLFISSGYQKSADALAYHIAEKKNLPVYFISLEDPKALSEISAIGNKALLYLIDFQILKKAERIVLFELLSDKQAIVLSTEKMEDIPFKVLDIKSENNIFEQSEILPIEEYVKYIVLNYQNKFPDTELSKKLGISRKSLWEKRKKYDILKKK
jgi:DNA-binding NtrC family response regulator